MSLSIERVEEAVIPDGMQQLKISDGGGLYLLVKLSGKYWKLAYRFGGKQKSLSLGVYPAVSLEDAREKRHQAKVLLAKGEDPCQVKKMEKYRNRLALDSDSNKVDEIHHNEHPEHDKPVDIMAVLAQITTEDRRLRTLQLLAGSAAYVCNEIVMQSALALFGHQVTSEALRTDLTWLCEQQLLLIDKSPVWVTKLTKQGVEAVNSRIWIDGLQRPEVLT
ncbi:MAG: Arm DNA-binding domain-containing protein [Mariprofundus sp.]|nr:Arm DNA-binding domain-containing protein [Mariprofundus sp.]